MSYRSKKTWKYINTVNISGIRVDLMISQAFPMLKCVFCLYSVYLIVHVFTCIDLPLDLSVDFFFPSLIAPNMTPNSE